MRIFVFVFTSLILSSLGVFADRNNPLPDYGDGYLTLYLDNDLFAGTDENYTNGLRLSWISGSRKINEVGSFQRGLRPLIGDDESFSLLERFTGLRDGEASYNFGFSLTQLIFTPTSLTAPTAPEGERPYAAHLGIGFSLHAKDEDTLNSAELTLGVIGSHAFGQEAQDFVHKVRGFEKFRGWDSQIPNEVTLSLSLVRKRRIQFLDSYDGILGADGISEVGGVLGNFRTEAFLGFLARWGYRLPESFADPRLSYTAYSHKPFNGRVTREDGDWSFYLLGGARLTVVGFDASLDGPLFRDFSTGVESEPLVGEAYLGFGARYKKVEVSYVQTFRTKEFKSQQEDNQSFGSLAVRYRF